jgi:hypothetical protein
MNLKLKNLNNLFGIWLRGKSRLLFEKLKKNKTLQFVPLAVYARIMKYVCALVCESVQA